MAALRERGRFLFRLADQPARPLQTPWIGGPFTAGLAQWPEMGLVMVRTRGSTAAA
jgi:hypothetical protein